MTKLVTLTAALLAKGGFKALGPLTPGDLTYLEVTGRRPAGRVEVRAERPPRVARHRHHPVKAHPLSQEGHPATRLEEGRPAAVLRHPGFPTNGTVR